MQIGALMMSDEHLLVRNAKIIAKVRRHGLRTKKNAFLRLSVNDPDQRIKKSEDGCDADKGSSAQGILFAG